MLALNEYKSDYLTMTKEEFTKFIKACKKDPVLNDDVQ
jgi:hypothetical protein